MVTLSKDTVAWAIDHFTHHADTDIFPKAFEFKAIEFCRTEVIDALSKQDINQWVTRPLRRSLVPKHRYDFRVATQLDPLDSLFYMGLILETGEEIEKSRLSVDKNIVFSRRFKPSKTDFNIFDKAIGYGEFETHSANLASQFQYVVITDIADFYSRIYVHRLENALDRVLPTHSTHSNALKSLIKGWNQHISSGIPVGCHPSRLLAELVIDDVDKILLDSKFTFTRYVDDYRIFCNSREEAYERLTVLANALYDNHRLTLQARKTKILSSEEFVEQLSKSEEGLELEALYNSFNDILDMLGLDNPYEIVDYDSLEPDVQKQIDELNLEQLLDLQLNAAEIDISLTKFLINRFKQLQNTDVLWKLLTETEKLYPVFPEIVEYLSAIATRLTPEEAEEIGEFILDKLNGSVVSHLNYHRALIMSLFAEENTWKNASRFSALYNSSADSWFRSSTLLAIGRANQDHWIRNKKAEIEHMSYWEKRAFLYAASCLPKDERDTFYRNINRKLDPLEKHIVEWAKSNPIYP